MKVTNHEILRPKINNIESIENDTLYQRIKNDPTTNSAIQCLTELLQRQEKQIQELKEDLTDDALYILELLKEYYESENLISEWLFVNKNGHIHNRAMDLRIRRYCRLAGINEKSLHKIRSTYISLLRDAGVSFEKIAEEVGHKSVLTTMLNYSFDTQDDAENKRLINKGLNIHTA